MTSDGISNLVTNGQITTYKSDGTGLPDKTYALEIAEPVNLSSFKFSSKVSPLSGTMATYGADSRYNEKYTLHYDDKKNISIIEPLFNVKKGYHWGYKKRYPIAECTNAGDNEFYIQNFEEISGSSSGAAHSGSKFKSGAHSVSWDQAKPAAIRDQLLVQEQRGMALLR